MPRVFPERLTQSQKKLAQRRFLWFASINALSYALLAESVLVLFALQLGAGDFHIGLLTGYVYLTLVFVLLGKVMVSRLGAARTYSYCWFTRNLVAGSFVLAPWIYLHFSPQLGLGYLLVTSLLFFVFRAMGLSAENVLINDITGSEDRGRFIGQWQFFAYIAMLGMLIAVSFWLGDKPEFYRFQTVIAVGCVLGMAASGFMFGMPESVGPGNSSREPMLRALSLVYADRRLRVMMVAWGVLYSGIQLLVPFQLLAVKKGYAVGDRAAIVFVVLQMLGLVVGSWPVALLIDRSGPRPILIINVLGLAVLTLLWAVSPGSLNIYYTGALFFLVGWTLVGVFIAAGHYFQNAVPPKSLLNLNMLMLVIQGLAAGLAGTFLGGGLLELLPHFGLAGMEIYKTYFLAVVVAMLAALAAVFRLAPLADRRVKDVLGMLFSVRDWRALVNLQKLSSVRDHGESIELLDELGTLGSEFSERTLLEYLDSPLFTVRTAALDALDRIRFGSEASFRLIEEVKDGEFSTAFMAAEILGKHRVAEAAGALREALYSNDFFLEGKAMVSLAQLGDTASYGRIREIFRTTYNPRLTIHGARAIFFMGDPQDVALLLARLDPRALPAEHDQIIASVAGLLGWEEKFFRLMTLYNRNYQLGTDALAEEVERRLREPDCPLADPDRGLLRDSLAETAGRRNADPEKLMALFERAVRLDHPRAGLLNVLLADSAQRVKAASPRLRFSLTVLAAVVLLGGRFSGQ